MRFSLLSRNSIKNIQAIIKNEHNIVTEDKYIMHVKAGTGGNGMARYNGIGGNGGSIIFQPKPEVAFADIKKNLKGSMKIRGIAGSSSQKTKLIGQHSEDKIFTVPIGIEVVDRNSNILISRCTKPYFKYLIAQGGKGGCSTNNFKGEKGEEFDVEVHLKLRPNVGLVGFPNAGKSTLLKAFVPRKSVKIAPYPFTTVKPQMAFWTEKNIEENDDFTLSIADLPGLIEGASRNRGKGYAFLKHLEYCDIFLIVVDCTGFQLAGNLDEPFRTPLESIALLVKELEMYDNKFMTKPAVLLLNKIDIVKEKDEPQRLINILSKPGWEKSVSVEQRPFNPLNFDYVLPISAKSGDISSVKKVLKRLYRDLNPCDVLDEPPSEGAKLL